MKLSAILLALSSSTTLACPPPLTGSGEAVAFESGPINQCTLEGGDGLFAAINAAQFEGSARCGECLEVTGVAGTAVVKVVENCGDCAEGDLELAPQAALAVNGALSGREPVTWRRVACPVDGTLRFQFQGSNPFYLKIQARDHRYGIASMAYQQGDDFLPMLRTADNFFTANTTVPAGLVTVRVQATSGQFLLQSLGEPEQVGLIDGDRQFADCTEPVFEDGFETPTL
jgi:expansin (peptidoglycan-binding protein)